MTHRPIDELTRHFAFSEMSRRKLLGSLAATAGLGLAARVNLGTVAARSRSTSPVAALDPRLLDYPELVSRLTQERIEAPAHAIAGRVRLVQENLGAAPGHAFVLRIPDDVAEEAVLAALAPGSKAAAEETPEWFWRADFTGNPDRAAPHGGRAVALIDLSPGRYLVGNPYRTPAEHARVEVAPGPAASTAADDPASDDIVAMREMAFDLPAALPAGRRLWRVNNAGAMLHEIALLPVPSDATAEQVQTALGAILAAEATGATFEEQVAPPELGAAWAGWRPDLVASVGVTSPTRSVWAQIDLAPGTYAAVCFVPDPATFTPHLLMGMTKVFTVA